jgi:predicted nucleic acid-binding protein
MSSALIDTGIIVAFYNSADRYHEAVVGFLSECDRQLVTTTGCITESTWLLARSWRLQNAFLSHLAQGIYTSEPLLAEDFSRIAELNKQYADLPGDFSDLSLVSISERLDISEIATLDKDFDIYRRYRKQPFNRIFYP